MAYVLNADKHIVITWVKGADNITLSLQKYQIIYSFTMFFLEFHQQKSCFLPTTQ